jgi:predicted ester cyclase
MSTRTFSRTEIDRLIAEHYRAEVAVDIPAIVANFTEDVRHEILGQGALYGRQAAGERYERIFEGHVIDRFVPLRRLYGDDFAVDDALVEGRAIGRFAGMEGCGRPVRYRLLHIFEFRDGLIAGETAWLDVAAAGQQLA